MKKFVIIDGLSFLFRAYHAVRPLHRADGLQTNALYGFAQMMMRVWLEMKPDLCVVALDSIEKNFRYDIFPQYKANRTEMDPEMREQMPYFEPLIQAFGICGIRVEGVEADDIIATLVRQHQNEYNIVIVSSDKDLMQLLDANHVRMFDTMRNREMGCEAVQEKFGVSPQQVIEVQALIGDSSDNVLGVPGIGPKTAAILIERFGNLEGIYDNLQQVEREKLREILQQHREQAFLSRALVTLKTDVALPFKQEAFKFAPTLDAARDFLLQMEFKTLAQRLEKFKEPVPAEAVIEKAVDAPAGYETIQTIERLEWWCAQAKQQSLVAIDTETTSLNAMQAQLVGISMALAAGQACYIPLSHVTQGEDLYRDQSANTAQIPLKTAVEGVGALLCDPAVRVIGHNLKYDWTIFTHYGQTEISNYEDTMLMSFCLDAGLHNHNMDTLALKHLNHKTITFSEVCGSGRNQITFDRVPLDKATAYAAEDADITFQLYTIFKKRLEREKLWDFYCRIERPLLPVLVAMERCGVSVNKSQLSVLSQQFQERLIVLEAQIHDLAGEPFNVLSPKQLGQILYTKMGLRPGGKKATSTNVEMMEKLADEGHEIAVKVLEYRQLSKLRSTYTEALLKQVNPATGRVHTSYHQSGAATGRFSSSDPNLQNIPIRTEEGRKIRHAFVPKQGWVLLSADYSQIELRLLAHAGQVSSLKQAFIDGKDIHASTAAGLFNVAVDLVEPEQRRIAKIINFGIVYGMGAVALAKQIGVPRKQAQEYIENYFKRYDGVRVYMDETIAFAQKYGYVQTIFGRRIHTPNINSKQPMLKAGAERAAINAPLQGANADIIKLAMAELDKILKQAKLQTRMLMQVHDELVFEIPEEELEQAQMLIRQTMESVVKLDVPLKVGMAWGKTWEEAHA